MNPEATRKIYGRNLEIYLYIVFLLMLFSSFANILHLFPSLYLFLVLITLRFRLNNYKPEIYYLFQVIIIILQGLVLIVIYLFRSIYIHSISLTILFYGFVASYVFLITLSIYYYHKGIPLFQWLISLIFHLVVNISYLGVSILQITFLHFY